MANGSTAVEPLKIKLIMTSLLRGSSAVEQCAVNPLGSAPEAHQPLAENPQKMSSHYT